MLEVATPLSVTATQPAPPVAAEHHLSFHEVLSALNPLQYVPVLGTIYRAITNDQIPEPLRRIGTFIVSTVTGGPVGALINIALLAAEKISGFDIDKTGQSMLAGNHTTDAPAVAKPAPAQAPAQAQTPAPTPAQAARPTTPAPAPAAAWSPAQLATAGVSTTADGTLKLADLLGADVLNSLELSRIQTAHSAYGRALRLAA